MRYGYKNSKGKISIDSSAVFCDMLSNRDPLKIDDYKAFVDGCVGLVKTEFQPNPNALNNVRGNWYEWLISVGSLNYLNQIQPKPKMLLLPLPNVSSLDYNALYVQDVYAFIQDLTLKTSRHQVSLISSNPDYAIVSLLGCGLNCTIA